MSRVSSLCWAQTSWRVGNTFEMKERQAPNAQLTEAETLLIHETLRVGL